MTDLDQVLENIFIRDFGQTQSSDVKGCHLHCDCLKKTPLSTKLLMRSDFRKRASEELQCANTFAYKHTLPSTMHYKCNESFLMNY